MSVQINIRACYDCAMRMKGSFPSNEETHVALCNICKESRYTNPYVMTFETVEPAKEELRNPAEYKDWTQPIGTEPPACCD